MFENARPRAGVLNFLKTVFTHKHLSSSYAQHTKMFATFSLQCLHHFQNV